MDGRSAAMSCAAITDDDVPRAVVATECRMFLSHERADLHHCPAIRER